jgi:hypothetical protein
VYRKWIIWVSNGYHTHKLFKSGYHVGIRVIRSIVRQTQHQNPEFGHTLGEIKKKPARKYISIQEGGGLW